MPKLLADNLPILLLFVLVSLLVFGYAMYYARRHHDD
jgi:hypothetical protein